MCVEGCRGNKGVARMERSSIGWEESPDVKAHTSDRTSKQIGFLILSFWLKKEEKGRKWESTAVR
jgi:hypothetical protein